VASLRAGARLTTEQLAIAAGSHHGTGEQVAVVRSTLESAGLREEDLGCPPALPADPTALRAAAATGPDTASPDGPEPRRIWHNCSGKHAGMLAACAASGWDTASYLQARHPYQEVVREVIAGSLGTVHATTTDGCGAPIHAISVRELAGGYARLFWGHPHGVEVAGAMAAHPVLVGGHAADDTRLMQLLPGLVAKRGAEGVFAVSAPGAGAVVVKVSDGAMRPAVMVALRLLALLGVDTSPAGALAHAAVMGGGLPVGSVEPSLALLAAVQGE
nr:asparaginase [Actinomycetales bacterium]